MMFDEMMKLASISLMFGIIEWSAKWSVTNFALAVEFYFGLEVKTSLKNTFQE